MTHCVFLQSAKLYAEVHTMDPHRQEGESRHVEHLTSSVTDV